MATTPFGWRPWAQNGYGLQRWTATNHVPITPLYDEPDEGLGAAAAVAVKRRRCRRGAAGEAAAAAAAGLATHVNLNKRKLLFVPN